MIKQNKKAPNESEHHKTSKTILSEWQNKIKQTYFMISEIESIKQLDCFEQELKEEGLNHLIKFTQNRREELCID